MKKSILLFWVIILHTAGLYSHGNQGRKPDDHELLKTLVMTHRWEELADLFLLGKEDENYRQLKHYFAHALSVKFSDITSDSNLTYKAKFSRSGEIGTITFEKKDGKYSHMEIGNQIRPLYFIEIFEKFVLSDPPLYLTMGDAVVRFDEGTFYRPSPFPFFFLFNGKWEFSITPNDEEERLTMKRKLKSSTLTLSPGQGIFLLAEFNGNSKSSDNDLIHRLIPAGKTTVPELKRETDAVSELFGLYNKRYGIKTPQFNEYWYLPFPQSACLAIFPRERQCLYIYSYKRDSIPDTQLVTTANNNILLSYNGNKGLKLAFDTPAENEVGEIKLNLFYNPRDNFISGTAEVKYKRPSTLHALDLAAGLTLLGTLDKESAVSKINIFTKGSTYYMMGPAADAIKLLYKGSIEAGDESLEFFKTGGSYLDRRRRDNFFYLSKTVNFYPNPGEAFFFKTDVTLNLPPGMNALAPGIRQMGKKTGERNSLHYTAEHSKGISLVCGEFDLRRELEGKLPVRIYCSPAFDYMNYVDLEEIRSAANFFMERYGPPPFPVVNILLKRGVYEGGISNGGFAVININPNRKIKAGGINPFSWESRSPINSPALIRNNSGDYIIHELAHQWWGGKISWKTYTDVWITEGLSHFSVLYYLRYHLPERQYNRIIKKLKHWVYRYSGTGPIAYGTRIHLLEDNYDAFQSVIYDKSALVFLMLLDILGEEKFLERLQSVLDKYAYRGISSMQFIRQFCGEEETITKFFKSWIYSRKLPHIRFDARINPDDKHEYEISVEQVDGNFVFPLVSAVVTESGTSYKTFIIKEKKQTFSLKSEDRVRSIGPVDHITPVRIDKN
jgi:hypothetical protein